MIEKLKQLRHKVSKQEWIKMGDDLKNGTILASFPPTQSNDSTGSVLMVSALVSRSSGPSSSPGQGDCVALLGKTLYSHIASLHPGL